MSLEESRKRKTDDKHLNNVENQEKTPEELPNEPQVKLQKMDEVKSESNLTSTIAAEIGVLSGNNEDAVTDGDLKHDIVVLEDALVLGETGKDQCDVIKEKSGFEVVPQCESKVQQNSDNAFVVENTSIVENIGGADNDKVETSKRQDPPKSELEIEQNSEHNLVSEAASGGENTCVKEREEVDEIRNLEVAAQSELQAKQDLESTVTLLPVESELQDKQSLKSTVTLDTALSVESELQEKQGLEPAITLDTSLPVESELQEKQGLEPTITLDTALSVESELQEKQNLEPAITLDTSLPVESELQEKQGLEPTITLDTALPVESELQGKQNLEPTIKLDTSLPVESELQCKQNLEPTIKLDTPLSVVETVEPKPLNNVGISIKFEDEKASELYKSKFLKFIHNFVELEAKSVDKLTIEVYIDDVYKSAEWPVVDETLKVTEICEESPRKRKKKSKAKKELFILDVNPSPTTTSQDLRYTSKFTINTEKEAQSLKRQPSRQTCFNCDEYHNLRDCSKPKDYARINAARQKFKPQQRVGRYHVEDEQKFSHLKPGLISNELRNALGLRKNETPHYIYMMRTMGYPPGWLEEAKFVHSNLTMFDFDGNNVQGNAVKKRGLDPEKIVDFPGFNIPLEKGMKDEYRDFGVPPFSENYSKEAMINYFDQQFGKEEDNFEMCDLGKEQKAEAKPVVVAKMLSEETIDSPSLPDLEKQKQQLLDELKNEDKPSSNLDDVAVKTTSFGTPIFKSNSPYGRLPNLDNFSKDVSPVINFENLPNSTGKYEQMTDVLQKVRTTLKKIQNGAT